VQNFLPIFTYYSQYALIEALDSGTRIIIMTDLYSFLHRRNIRR